MFTNSYPPLLSVGANFTIDESFAFRSETVAECIALEDPSVTLPDIFPLWDLAIKQKQIAILKRVNIFFIIVGCDSI